MSEKFICPHCQKPIAARLINSWKARQAGKVKSDARAAASRENGKMGGRPRGSTTKRKK
ncbi:MAG: hypothetical protein AAGI48_03910 [Verrucomicrobiota bacterium]